MPIYEYTCKTCQHDFELLMRGGDEPICPTCGTDELEKLFSVPAAHTSTSTLPVCDAPAPSMCGRPQCGMGGCQLE